MNEQEYNKMMDEWTEEEQQILDDELDKLYPKAVWTRENVYIAYPWGKQEVRAWTYRGIFVHRILAKPATYRISHVQTGLGLGVPDHRKLASAKKIAEAIADNFPGNLDKYTECTEQFLDGLRIAIEKSKIGGKND